METAIPKTRPSSFEETPAVARQRSELVDAAAGPGAAVSSLLLLRRPISGEDDDGGSRRALDRQLILRRFRRHRRTAGELTDGDPFQQATGGRRPEDSAAFFSP